MAEREQTRLKVKGQVQEMPTSTIGISGIMKIISKQNDQGRTHKEYLFSFVRGVSREASTLF